MLMLGLSAECGAPGPAATSPCVLPEGHVQLEGDFASATFDRDDKVRMQAVSVGPWIVKAPVGRRTQLEIGLAPFSWTNISAAEGASHHEVVGPDTVALRLKQSLIAGERVSVAVHPGVRLPLVARAEAELMFGVPLAVALSARWSLTLNPEIRAGLRSSALRFHNLVGFSRPVGQAWILVTEVLSVVDLEHDAAPSHLVVLSVDYTPREQPNLHLDVGVGAGLNEIATDGVFFLSFSRRY